MIGWQAVVLLAMVAVVIFAIAYPERVKVCDRIIMGVGWLACMIGVTHRWAYAGWGYVALAAICAMEALLVAIAIYDLLDQVNQEQPLADNPTTWLLLIWGLKSARRNKTNGGAKRC
jgi:hypothetical protein